MRANVLGHADSFVKVHGCRIEVARATDIQRRKLANTSSVLPRPWFKHTHCLKLYVDEVRHSRCIEMRHQRLYLLKKGPAG